MTGGVRNFRPEEPRRNLDNNVGLIAVSYEARRGAAVYALPAVALLIKKVRRESSATNDAHCRRGRGA